MASEKVPYLYPYLPFFQVLMHDFRKNSIFRLVSLIANFIKKSFQTVQFLLFGLKSREDTTDYQLLHHLLQTGPKSFYQLPTAIKAGRSIASFFLLLFSNHDFIADKKTPPKP